MPTLIAGIDIGLTNNDVCTVSDTGEVIVAHQRFAHTHPGCEALAAELVEQLAQGDFDQLQIAGESTGLQWFHLFWYLQHAPEFDDLDVELYLVNARAVAKSKPSRCEQEKTDVKDAYAIAVCRFSNNQIAGKLRMNDLAIQHAAPPMVEQAPTSMQLTPYCQT